MKRLSQTIAPSRRAAKKGTPTILVNSQYYTLNFSSTISNLKEVQESNYVEFLEDDDQLYVHFNKELGGYKIGYRAKFSSTDFVRICNKSLTTFLIEKYNVVDKTFKFIVAIGAGEQQEDGIKFPIFYKKKSI